MGYGPYKIFDKNHPEHPDYKADDDDEDDIQLSLPLDYVKKNQDMKIARGIVRKVEDIKNLSAEDQARAIGIIYKSSRGMERDKRMGNFLTDLYD